MSTFNIEEYFNSLQDDVEDICISGQNLTYLPDLSRFTNLKGLFCSHNQLVTLPLLPNSLRGLYCSNNQLISLPPLPNSLTGLDCYSNKLVTLPPLPNSLKILNCDNNKLVSLPQLPNSLIQLKCYNNQLVHISSPPDSLRYFIFANNPIHYTITTYNYNAYKENLRTLNKFRDLYYCIKYKNKFRKWLWSIREKKVKEEYHPDRLREMLKDKDIDDIDF